MPDKFDTPSAQFLERKLSTILSADVAEFSRLMGQCGRAASRLPASRKASGR